MALTRRQSRLLLAMGFSLVMFLGFYFHDLNIERIACDPSSTRKRNGLYCFLHNTRQANQSIEDASGGLRLPSGRL